MTIAIEKYIVDSLSLETKWIMPLLEKDKKIMYNFGIASFAIRNGKYKNNKVKQRLKLASVKDEFIECFLCKFLATKKVVVNIIVKLVKDYWINFNSYDNIIKQIDKLLWKSETIIDPVIVPCNCRNDGFGFCFCRMN